MRKDEEIYNQLSQDDYKVQKYKKVGIYAIYTAGVQQQNSTPSRKLLYIGKSMNMLKRISAHLAHIQHPYCNESFQHKYNIMRQINTLEFDILEYTIPSLLEQKEAYWIGKLKPLLNTQIPKPEGKGYTINKKAKSITLEEVMNNEKE